MKMETKEKPDKTRHCFKCRKYIPTKSNYCLHCGYELNQKEDYRGFQYPPAMEYKYE